MVKGKGELLRVRTGSGRIGRLVDGAKPFVVASRDEVAPSRATNFRLRGKKCQWRREVSVKPYLCFFKRDNKSVKLVNISRQRLDATKTGDNSMKSMFPYQSQFCNCWSVVCSSRSRL